MSGGTFVNGGPCPRCGGEFPPGASPAGLCPACLLKAAFSTDSGDDPVDTPATILAAGTDVGPFRILGLLGMGGMAAVYEAHDERLDRTIALKVLPPEFLHDASFSRRFEQEARLIAKLEHPNIVPIYASGIDNASPWMGMRLLTGGTLGDLLGKGRLEAGEAARILRQVADALDYAHARGIVHRDIKPSNILLDGSGAVCLGDFGLAQILGTDSRVTRTGILIGTPHYMAPEQALGEPAGHRSDIYSLGIVAYEMFVGALPFTGESPVAVLLKHVNQPLPEPPNDLLPRPLVDAIAKALAKNPDERWGSAGAFAQAVEVALSAPTHDMGIADIEESSRPRRREFRWGAVAAGVVAASMGVAWWMARDGVALVPSAAPGPSAVSVPLALPVTESSEQAEPSVPPSNVPRPSNEPVKPGGSAPIPFKSPSPSRPTVVDGEKPSQPDPSPPVPDVAVTEEPLISPDQSAPAVADQTSPDSTPQPSREIARDIVTPPERIRFVNPDYPMAARAAQLEGDVRIRAVVAPDGSVGHVTVLRSVHPVLDEAARNAVRKYVYKPAMRNGSPEPFSIDLTVSFRLQ